MTTSAIETSFGTFHLGDHVLITMTTECGGTVKHHGIIRGERHCRGTKYLLVEGTDGQMYDVTLRAGYVDSVELYDKKAKTIEHHHHMEEETYHAPKPPKQYSKVIR